MHKKGFTLLELIIVIGILAALSAVSIPQISRYSSSQSLQGASAGLQQALRTMQSNALNGIVCSDNPSNIASEKWSLIFTSQTLYETRATCITVDPPLNPTPVAISSTTTFPMGVEVFEIWIDNIICSNIPGNISTKMVGFRSISGKIDFIDNSGADCSILPSSKKMWIGLRLTDDTSKKIYVVVDRGGSIYVSSETPS